MQSKESAVMKAQKLGLGARAFGGLAGGDWDLAGRSSHYQSVFDFFNPFFIPMRVPSQFIAFNGTIFPQAGSVW